MKQSILKEFSLEDRDGRELPALSLAFLGDAVYELVVRTLLTQTGRKPSEISREKTRLVNAGRQAAIARALLQEKLLTPQEEAVLRRGRNANPHTLAKHAAPGDYHLATGLECLLGHLYWKEETERLIWLIRTGIENTEEIS